MTIGRVEEAHITGKIPNRWQRSDTAQLAKNNGKDGTKGRRVINILSVMEEIHTSIVWKR